MEINGHTNRTAYHRAVVRPSFHTNTPALNQDGFSNKMPKSFHVARTHNL